MTVVHCTYDPQTKAERAGRQKGKRNDSLGGKGDCLKAECRLYENLVDEEKGKLNADGTLNLNPNSLTVLKECYVEPSLKDAKPMTASSLSRNGYFCVDCKDSTPEKPVFNRIVSLKSSFKLGK